jgi:hypothetical protein
LPATGGVVTETLAGNLAKGAMVQVKSVTVVPGTSLVASMTGTGDPDLYVRFDAAPSTSYYDCRPYLEGAGEECSLTVPPGASTAYVAVHGYAAGSYRLSVTYASPPSATEGGTAKTATLSGKVAQTVQSHHGPLGVLPGTRLTVKMTGTGDPDLYLRFGGKPTLTLFDCRPFATGATESCSLTVPTGGTSAYLMVNGFTAGSYTLQVQYIAP